MFTRKLALSAFIVGMTTVTAYAADLTTVTKTAIETNPEVQAKWFEFLETLEIRDEAKGAYLPSIDLNAAYGKGQREFDNRDWFNQGQAEISLTQMLFDGFKTKNKVEQRDYAALRSYYELNAGLEEKAFESARAYLDVQRYRELVELAKVNIANHQRVYTQVAQRTNQGVVNRADLSQISGRLSLAETNLVTEQTNLSEVLARFHRLVGIEAPAVLAPDNLNLNVPTDRTVLLKNAYQNNYSLRAALSEIAYAKANAEEFKSNLYPRLDFVAKHGVYQNRNSFDERANPRDYGQDTAVELRLNYNLYSGGSHRAAVNAANARVLRTEDMRNKACIDIRQNVTIALNNIQNYKNQMNWLQRHKDESLAVVVAYRDQFDIGRRSLLDVLDSENESFQSNRAYASALYDLKISQLQALYSSNQLLPALGIKRDNLPEVSDVSHREIDAENVCLNAAQAQS